MASIEPTQLELLNPRRGRDADITAAICEPPTITQTIDGASTLEVTVNDHRRTLLASGVLGEHTAANVVGRRWELVAVGKSGDRFRLTFEDSVIHALRKPRGLLSIPAGSTTRRQFVVRLAREAGVKFAVDADRRGKVAVPLKREKKGSSWDLLGEVAEAVRWRRFSDGARLIVGSDEWLFGRDPNPTKLREHAGGVHTIDFDLDTGKRASIATATVDVALWALPPGAVALVEDLGPASGKWLVGEFTRTLTSERGTVKLVRARHVLPEPKKEKGSSR